MQSTPLVVNSRSVPPLHVLGTEVRFLCEGQSTKNAWSLMEVTLPQEGGPPPHTHAWDEAYFVLEGDVRFTVGDQVFTASTGDFLYTPGGVAHGFSGESQQPARVLIFDAPAHAGAFFKRVDREVKVLPRDLVKVQQIGEDTGIRFLQPA
ncbi:MAG: cupin domain-containing protein [Caldimonas sp.]